MKSYKRGESMKKLMSFLYLIGFFMTAKTHAGEKNLYDFLWLDPDKSVYVLQNKVHKKEQTFYLDLGYISNFTSKFQDTNGVSLKGGFYVFEEWGLEVFYNQYQNRDNEDYKNIRLINEAEPFIRKFSSSYGANIIWSPFYGKINTFNKIIYFDWSVGAGLAQVNTKSNLKNVRNPSQESKYENEKNMGAVLKTGVKFHLNKNVHVGLEYMNTYYKSPGPKNPSKDKLNTNTDVILSIGFSF